MCRCSTFGNRFSCVRCAPLIMGPHICDRRCATLRPSLAGSCHVQSCRQVRSDRVGVIVLTKWVYLSGFNPTCMCDLYQRAQGGASHCSFILSLFWSMHNLTMFCPLVNILWILCSPWYDLFWGHICIGEKYLDLFHKSNWKLGENSTPHFAWPAIVYQLMTFVVWLKCFIESFFCKPTWFLKAEEIEWYWKLRISESASIPSRCEILCSCCLNLFTEFVTEDWDGPHNLEFSPGCCFGCSENRKEQW